MSNTTRTIDMGDDSISEPWEYYLYNYPHLHMQMTRNMSIKNKVERYFTIKSELPDCHRSAIWRNMFALDKVVDDPLNKNIYNEYLNLHNEDIESDVATDAVRTFPSSTYKKKMMMTQQGNKQSLFNVLKAYAIYNEEVQYTQGMNYLALVLLCYFNELDSFWMMDLLIKNHGMNHFFRKNNTLLPSYLKIFESELYSQLPQLSTHFTSEGIKPYMFIPAWWSTIFVYILPIESVVIVWDYFFWGANGLGIEVLFKLSIALLKMLQGHVMGVGMSRFFEIIRGMAPSISAIDMVHCAKNIILTDDTIKFLKDKVSAHNLSIKLQLDQFKPNRPTTSTTTKPIIKDQLNQSNLHHLSPIKSNNNNNDDDIDEDEDDLSSSSSSEAIISYSSYTTTSSSITAETTTTNKTTSNNGASSSSSSPMTTSPKFTKLSRSYNDGNSSIDSSLDQSSSDIDKPKTSTSCQFM